MKHAICLFVFFASVINVPITLTPQNGSSRATSKDPKVSWTAEWGMGLTQFQGKKAVRLTEQGSGRLSTFSHLGVLNLIRPFLAKTSFWFTVAAPHYWIRYQGPESGPGTPEVVLELAQSAH